MGLKNLTWHVGFFVVIAAFLCTSVACASFSLRQTISFPSEFDSLGTTIAVTESDLLLTGRDSRNRPAGLFFRKLGNGKWNLVTNITYVNYQPSFAYRISLSDAGRAALEALIMNFDAAAGEWTVDAVVAPAFDVAPQVLFLSADRVAITALNVDYGQVLQQQGGKGGEWLPLANFSAPQQIIRAGGAVDTDRQLLFVPAYANYFGGNDSILVVDASPAGAGRVLTSIEDPLGSSLAVYNNAQMLAQDGWLVVPSVVTGRTGLFVFRSTGSDADGAPVYKFTGEIVAEAPAISGAMALLASRGVLAVQRMMPSQCGCTVELYALSKPGSPPLQVLTPPPGDSACFFGGALAFTPDGSQLIVSDSYNAVWGSVYVYVVAW